MATLEFSSPDSGQLLEPFVVHVRAFGADPELLSRCVELWTNLPSIAAPTGGVWHAETAVWTRPPAGSGPAPGPLDYKVLVIPTALGASLPAA